MADKKKISLSGLTKGSSVPSSSSSSSSPFMSSFRFSPESEEIEEITIQQVPLTPSESSVPGSPKTGGGDTSPLKEYLLKERHRWAHKWDKKSLSLDLDIKGKFKTAFEDRTKSILSNFIPEESQGTIHTSQSIPENIAARVYSSSLENNSGSKKKEGSSDGSQDTLDGEESVSSSDIFKQAQDNGVEEVGFDMTDYEFNALVDRDGDTIIGQLPYPTFNIKPEELQELFDGLPTLYQPLSLIAGIRPIPLEMAIEDNFPNPSQSLTKLQPDKHESPSSQNQGIVVNPSDLEPSHVFFNILTDVIFHPLMKYWLVMIAAVMVLPFGPFVPFVWFVLGAFTVIVIGRGLSSPPPLETHNMYQEYRAPVTSTSGDETDNPLIQRDFTLNFPTMSQGWMTQMEGDYDVETCNMRQTRLVYVRLENFNLFLSTPHPKHKVPKRRLWNDPVIDKDFTFTKHSAFNISGAEITLVPNGLAKRRAWNKKYPIAIKFPKHAVCHFIIPPPNPDSTSDNGSKDNSNAGPSVKYDAATTGISVNSAEETPAPTLQQTFSRKDFGNQIVYLFARCDREKDDWYRRFEAASKLGPESPHYLHKSPENDLIQYYEFMRRICPTLTPFLSANVTSEGYDNVSIVGDLTGESKLKSNPAGRNSSGSPGSSKKGTPEREKGSFGENSEIENITTIPQSPAAINALLGRLFFDFLKSNYGQGAIQTLIDKKLHFMRKPPFIEYIQVKDLNLGDSLPTILRASHPVLDHQGLWIDFDLMYDGNFCVSLETRINLLKLVTKKPRHADTSSDTKNDNNEPTLASNTATTSKAEISSSPSGGRKSMESPNNEQNGSRVSNVYDSEADDSGESSEEEDDTDFNNLLSYNPNSGEYVDPNIPNTKHQKLLKISEKIANSSFMNRAIVKKLVNNVAATPLVLSLELQGIFGTLTVNVPAPPNDRVWLGFRTNPDLNLIAKPLKFGATNINISQITEFIRKKLILEFQRAVVCPNMVDITVPIMEFSMP